MNLLIVTQKVDENDQLLGFFPEWMMRFSLKFEKITVLCLEKGKFNLPDNLIVKSLGKDCGVSKLKQLSNFYYQIFALRDDYDAVFVHMNPIWVILGGPSWYLMRKRIFFWYTHKAITSKLRIAEKFADVIFTASKESFRLKSKKVIVTGHGIDTELFKPNYELRIMNYELIKILSVGRIASVKNYETLVEAGKILKDRGIKFVVMIVGEAPLSKDKDYERNIKGKIREFGLDDCFNFVGRVSHGDLPDYYRSNDMFIHLSKTGSLDKTILEAMACGMRVLSSNDASKSFLPPDAIFDGNNPIELAERIISQSKSEANEKLRDYVVKNHNLDKLIDKISYEINNR